MSSLKSLGTIKVLWVDCDLLEERRVEETSGPCHYSGRKPPSQPWVGRLLPTEGEREEKRRAITHFALHPDSSTMEGHNLVAQVKS